MIYKVQRVTALLSCIYLCLGIEMCSSELLVLCSSACCLDFFPNEKCLFYYY